MHRELILEFFPQSNLDPIESYVFSDIHLRFELGGEFANGTIERVNNSTNRISELFERLFLPTDDVIVLIKKFAYDGAREFNEPTRGYFEEQFSGVDLEAIKSEIKEEIESGDFYNIESDITEFSTTTIFHIQKIFETRVSNINYKNIFRGIANLEMGFDPSVSDVIYIVNKRSRVAIHMYDDRGCMVYASDKEAIRFLYQEYYNWLVKYHIKTFEDIFGGRA